MHKLVAHALAAISLIATAWITLPAPSAVACQCRLDEPFSEVSKEADLVVLGRVLNHGYPPPLFLRDTNFFFDLNEMNLQVLEVFSGSETRSVIRVWGGDGMMCRPGLGRFEDGEILVMALHKTIYMDVYAVEENEEQPPDYQISNCGAYWLTVEDEMAIGDVFDDESDRGIEEETGEPDRVSFNRIRRFFE